MLVKQFVGFITVFLLIFFLSSSCVFAAFNFNVSTISSNTISSLEQQLEVYLNISNLPSGDNYFRISAQKESGGAYFGYMQNNNNEWTQIQSLSADCTSYYKLSDSSVEALNLKFKLGEDVGNGSYIIKAHRFTSSCKTYSEASTSALFTINLPTPTPTSAPTNAPTALPTTASPSTQTSTPTTFIPVTIEASIDEDVLGETTDSAGLWETNYSSEEISDIPRQDAKVLGKNNSSPFIISIGLILLSCCGILAIRRYRKYKNEITNFE